LCRHLSAEDAQACLVKVLTAEDVDFNGFQVEQVDELV
jgi:hypothetical protein